MRATISFLIIIISSLHFASCAWPNEVPFWPLYPLRGIQVLDGDWEFGFVNTFNGDVTSTTINTNAITLRNKTFVPSAFDYVLPGYEGPRGTAFYRTYITVPANEAALIYFASCAFYCNVYVDNVNIGDHRAGGYAPFWLTIPPSSNTNRTLFVLADNRWNSTTAPVHTGGDFYCFGGIHRSVIVHTSPVISSLFLQRVEISTTDIGGLVNISVVLSTTSTVKVDLQVNWDDKSFFTVSGTAVNGVYTISNAKVPNPTLWSIGSPNLHVVTVELLINNQPVDAIVARFGLRVLGIDSGSRITINGERVKLHGFNRHTMFPGTGPSLTFEQTMTDIKILQDLGVNYVRGSHYPQDQRFLDLCDEVGIVIWEEALGPGVATSNIQNPYFMQHQIQQINEMISASFNHPSIILFAFFNEGPSDDPNACPGYLACVEAIHNRTSTHYATWANDHLLSDVCLKYADVISFNSYPGWYDHNGNYTYPLSFWTSTINQAATEYKQPITVSETGCEGLFEWINTTSVVWGQEYQNQVIPNDIKAILGEERVTGLTLWVFADFKGNDGAQSECGPCTYYPNTYNATYINIACDGKCGFGCRPCGENHKGTVDFWRREKIVYSQVKTLYNQNWP